MKNRIKIPAILFIIIFSVCFNLTAGQQYLKKINNSEQENNAKLVLGDIENGIAEGNVKTLIGYFSTQTYLSLSNGINGYYSSNQAYYVLENFFRDNQVSGFKFNDTQIEKGNMYGTGAYTFVTRGRRSDAQVYVSLKHTGIKWKITQLTIN